MSSAYVSFDSSKKVTYMREILATFVNSRKKYFDFFTYGGTRIIRI